MEARTETIPMQLENGTLIKVEASAHSSDVDVLDLEGIISFKEVADTIEGIANQVLATLERVKPDKANVEFGVEVGVESGGVTALLVKGTGKGNLKITL